MRFGLVKTSAIRYYRLLAFVPLHPEVKSTPPVHGLAGGDTTRLLAQVFNIEPHTGNISTAGSL